MALLPAALRRRGLAELVLPGGSAAVYLVWALSWLVRAGAAPHGNLRAPGGLVAGLYYLLVWVLVVGFLLPYVSLVIYRWGRLQRHFLVACATETVALIGLLVWLFGFFYTPVVFGLLHVG